MRTFAIIALVGLVSVVRSDLPHYLLEKSFNTALEECAEYYEISSCDLKQYIAESFPDKPTVRRLIRCALLNLQSWNDDSGISHPQFSAFFKPSPADTCYENRTQVCLCSVPARAKPMDYDSLAYESFQCYYRSYGDLVDCNIFLQSTPLELDQILVATSDYLQLSEETLVDFCKGNILNNARFPEVVYVFMVRGAFLSASSGVRLDRLYIQYGNASLIAPETQRCVDKVTGEYCSADNKTIAYQVFIQCLDAIIPFRKQLQEFSKKRVSDPAECDCTSPQIQVYNVA